jgi:hypothetical protein
MSHAPTQEEIEAFWSRQGTSHSFDLLCLRATAFYRRGFSTIFVIIRFVGVNHVSIFFEF